LHVHPRPHQAAPCKDASFECTCTIIDYDAGEPGTALPDDAVKTNDIVVPSAREMVDWAHPLLQVYVASTLERDPGLRTRQQAEAPGLLGRMFGHR
jgi:hypothetical protein